MLSYVCMCVCVRVCRCCGGGTCLLGLLSWNPLWPGLGSPGKAGVCESFVQLVLCFHWDMEHDGAWLIISFTKMYLAWPCFVSLVATSLFFLHVLGAEVTSARFSVRKKKSLCFYTVHRLLLMAVPVSHFPVQHQTRSAVLLLLLLPFTACVIEDTCKSSSF